MKKYNQKLNSKDITRLIAVLLIAFNLIIYQAALPLSIAHAQTEEESGEQDAVETASSTEGSEEETADEEEKDEEQEAAEVVEQESENSDQEIIIENENEADIDNDVDVDSNTGENTANGNADVGADIEETANDNADNICECEDNIDSEESADEGEEQADDECGCASIGNEEGTDPEAVRYGAGVGTEENTNENEQETNEANEEDGSDDAGEENNEEEEENNGAEDGDADEKTTDDTADQNADLNADENLAAEIDTGDAVAVVDVYNQANFNLVGENFEEAIVNLYGTYIGDIDLLAQLEALWKSQNNADSTEEADNTDEENADEKCNADEDADCNADSNADIDIANENDADVDNDIEVNVNTGENEASDNGGDVKITTGDATAVVNVVNFVNVNIAGNNWLFAVVNVFGNWVGDLIVPGEGLLNTADINADNGCATDTCADYSHVTIENENDADVDNDIEVNVNTGGNEANDNEGGAEITTGNATSEVSVSTTANQNIVGNNWLMVVINGTGYWLGDVLGWFGQSADNSYSYNFNEGEADQADYADNYETGADADLAISNKNDADINNSITVNVNTGGNVANDNEGGAEITTGNASAFVNVVNFLNNNIVGNNWFFAMVNVLGVWDGDLVFAYPDVVVSIDDGKDSVSPGDGLSYEISYKNEGKANGEDIEVMVALSELVSYESDSSGQSPSANGNSYVWNIGDLDSGQSGTFVVNVKTTGNIGNVQAITAESAAAVKTSTKEDKTGNNYAVDQTELKKPFDIKNVKITEEDADGYDGLGIDRRNNIDGPVATGSLVRHLIAVENGGDEDVHDAYLEDKIKYENGEKVVSYTWDLGKLKAGKKILVQYEIVIYDDVQAGFYENRAIAYGKDDAGEEIESNKKTSGMQVVKGASFGYGYENPPADEGVIESAQAASEEDGYVEGISGVCNRLPFWIWLLAILAFFNFVNWALFPKKK